MIFLEGKRFYNHVLTLKKNENLTLRQINPSQIYKIDYLDKDKNVVKDNELQWLPASCK